MTPSPAPSALSTSTGRPPARPVTVTPSSGPLGAIVDCGDLRTLDDATLAAVRQAWLDNVVVAFRGQTLSDAELSAFGRRFGGFELSEQPLASPLAAEGKAKQGGVIDGFPEITVVSNVVENGVAIGGLGDGEVIWHTDRSNFASPPSATMLYALEVPEDGGMTGFCNMYLALDTLPAELRRTVDGLVLKHTSLVDAAGYVRKRMAQYAGGDPRLTPGVKHPLVRTHPETGRDCLFLGRRVEGYYIDGLEPAESEALLDRLWAHVARPELSWLHHWQAGDLVIWDNRCAMHRREPFPSTQRRVMHRIMIQGDAPFRAPAPTPPHPRGHLRDRS